jgi:hypothetical protein
MSSEFMPDRVYEMYMSSAAQKHNRAFPCSLVSFSFLFALSIASLCACVYAHSHYGPRPALEAAQKRAPEADPMFQLVQDRQLCARPERTTAIIPRANH